MAIITLLTDFGLQDTYVAEMKGALLRHYQRAAGAEAAVPTLVDITHEVPSWDIERGAWLLGTAYPAFPAGTIHLAVVDPGVGGPRKPILLKANGQWFLGPDNGLLSRPALADPDHQVFEIPMPPYRVSDTFHGRDLFGPAAGQLAAEGFRADRFSPLASMVLVTGLEPTPLPYSGWQGKIVLQDRFGNLATNLPARLRSGCVQPVLRVADMEIGSWARTFTDAQPEQASLIANSSGFIEIIVPNASAAEKLHLTPGTPVFLVEKQA